MVHPNRKCATQDHDAVCFHSDRVTRFTTNMARSAQLILKDTVYGFSQLVFPPTGVRVYFFRRCSKGTGGTSHFLRSTGPESPAGEIAITVNGSRGSRRLASPVRIALATQLGGDIDGAWWPHTSSVANELPELIEALHRPRGEINHIGINWSSTERSDDLDSMSYGGKSMPGWRDRRQRIMAIVGLLAHAKLLVVPHLTAPDLGWMILRRAAAAPIGDTEQDSQVFHTADLVMRAAQAESASWTTRTLGAQAQTAALKD